MSFPAMPIHPLGDFQWVKQRGISLETPEELSTLRMCLVSSQVNSVLVLKTNQTAIFLFQTGSLVA